MKTFSFFLVFLAVLLFGFRMFTFFSFDEQVVSTQVIPSAPARFIRRSREDLDLLKKRLSDLQELPESFFRELKQSDFGRKKLFLPDSKKKTLGSSSSPSS